MTWTLLGTIVSGVLLLASAVWVALLQRSTSPYEALSARVVQLEKSYGEAFQRLSGLEADQDILIAALIEQWDWQQAGSIPPPPAMTARALAVLTRHRARDKEKE